MSEQAGQATRFARAPEGAVGEELLAQAGELAKRWAIALILARPPDEIGAVPLEEIAREAPALCAGILRAVRSEGELERLIDPAGPEYATAARVPALRGAADGVRDRAGGRGASRRALAGAQAAQPLEDPRRLAGEIGDRLAYVCSAVLAVGLSAIGAGAAAAGPDLLEAAQPLPPQRGSGAPARRLPSSSTSATEPPDASPLLAGAEIAARDQRAGAGPAAWIGAIGAQLAALPYRTACPFAVLLVEVIDPDRLRAHEPPGELERLTAALEQLVRGELRARARDPGRGQSRTLAQAEGSLTRERAGALLAARAGHRPGGGASASPSAWTRAPAASHVPRQPRAVAVGAASCPEDGREAAALAAHADLELYAARAGARSPRRANRPAVRPQPSRRAATAPELLEPRLRLSRRARRRRVRVRRCGRAAPSVGVLAGAADDAGVDADGVGDAERRARRRRSGPSRRDVAVGAAVEHRAPSARGPCR